MNECTGREQNTEHTKVNVSFSSYTKFRKNYVEKSLAIGSDKSSSFYLNTKSWVLDLNVPTMLSSRPELS